MLTKILVLILTVAIASCSDRHYLKHNHESHKEYRHPYQHIQVQEPSSEEYKPEPGHAYSSQRLVHQGQSTYEEAHEHVPYQYKVNEQNSEENQEANQEQVQQKYRYPQHEVQTVRVPAHRNYYPEGHAVHQTYAPAYHVQEAQKVPAYRPESQEAHKAYYQPESHETPQKVQYQQSHEPIYVPEHHDHESHDEPIDYYAYPKYQYEYKVEDPHTGDNKFQHEVRDGDVVKGVYGLHEPDGSIRTVEYSSDKHHGFSAIVKHSAPGQHVHIETHHQKEHQHEHEN